ncbi:MAG: hypothetical protein K4305_10985, partial [Chlorobium sp.]|uniref:hypothetical protein n=1 Tax=Chlorobium sp. TaxID=1095 RepID=UPI002F424E3F
LFNPSPIPNQREPRSPSPYLPQITQLEQENNVPNYGSTSIRANPCKSMGNIPPLQSLPNPFSIKREPRSSSSGLDSEIAGWLNGKKA